MDIFKCFDEIQSVYSLLSAQNKDIDLSFGDFSGDNVDMFLQLKASSSPQVFSLSSKNYQNLPTKISGSVDEVNKKIKKFINDLKSVPLTFYAEFANALDRLFWVNGVSLVEKFYNSAKNSIVKTHKICDTLQVSVKLKYPGNMVVYSQEKNCQVSFRFGERLLCFAGFPLGLVDKTGYGYLPISSTEELENIVMESSFVGDIHILSESIDLNMDELLDTIIQKLVYDDLVDTVQDIFLDDGVIYFCFDPTLEQDFIVEILNTLKSIHYQSDLIGVPEEDCPWWIIAVGDDEKIIADLAGAEELKNLDADGVFADGVLMTKHQGTIDDAIGNLDVSKAINAVED